MKQTVGMGKATGVAARRPGRPVGGQLEVGREQVLDAAERVIAREGAGASIDAVAHEAGVTKPIVYDRVGGRADLADALAERLSDRMVAAAAAAIASETGLTKDSLTRFIEASLEVVGRNRNLFLYVTGGTTEQTALGRLKLAERSTTPMTTVLAQWRAGLGQDPAVAQAWAFGIVGMLQMVSLWWLTQDQRPAVAVAADVSDLLWHGLPGPMHEP
jgi:AcrR family transcriptional regulator